MSPKDNLLNTQILEKAHTVGFNPLTVHFCSFCVRNLLKYLELKW